MNRRVSPTLIGAFVLGAVALAVVAVIVFGSGRYFRKTREFVLYFAGSVNGLRVGAPVKFRGVEIGSVKDIRLRLERDLSAQRIPVIIEVDPEKVISRGGRGAILNDPQFRKNFINSGLRGQLQLESFVTGVLFVALDIHPETPAVFAQQAGGQGYRYEEIPTEPTMLDKARGSVNQILAQLAETDFKALVDSLTRAVAGVNQLVNSPDLKLTLRSVNRVTHQLGTTAANISQLATTLDGNVQNLTSDIRMTSAEARVALKQFSETIRQTGTTINDSPTLYELNRSLREIAGAARSLRLLTGYLEGNPRALLFGKPATKEE